ncbi:hypothetical protein CHS0354_011485 [Potamilus streckersoni]|uniref:Uncharacterized protein n=1 Tax=Potamilus streckersoni TaxID=2493646 RepID=A0AAE0VXM6_9BIVA|nr:hypothetical protein CHS0354_011485 [Potamilus streckersoni]
MEVVPSTNIVFSMEEEEELPDFKIGKTIKNMKSPEKISSRKQARSPSLGFKIYRGAFAHDPSDGYTCIRQR